MSHDQRLVKDDGTIEEDWLARQVDRLDVVEGDVATLSGRLAQIRTWTYAANRPGWVKDAAHWQDQTRKIEDRLSDALHETLTQRFVEGKGIQEVITLLVSVASGDLSAAPVIGMVAQARNRSWRVFMVNPTQTTWEITLESPTK